VRVNAGSIEMYNVLKLMKTVLKRVNSTAFEHYRRIPDKNFSFAIVVCL